MRILPLVGVLLTGLAGCATSPNENMAKVNQKPQVFQKSIARTVRAGYLLFLPEDYRTDTSKRWPVILFLHGAGERGTNLNKVAVHGPPKIVKKRKDFPFVVVSPQCPEGQIWSNDTLLALLDEVTGRLNVDTNRIYLTGLSMGGFGTWNLGLAHPERFAALAPICGGGDTIGIILAEGRRSRALKSLPVWAFHGGKDTVVRLEESERMVNALKEAGCKEVELTVYPDAGHDSWTETYNDERLYQWFLKHKRKSTR